MRIRIAVQHQNACSIAGQRLRCIGYYNNKLSVKIIDNFCVIVTLGEGEM